MKHFIVALIVILFISCSDGKVSSGKGAGESSVSTLRQEFLDSEKKKGSQNHVNQIEQSIINSRNNTEKTKNKVSVDNYSNKRFLLKINPSAVTPQDFVIGALTSQIEENSPEMTVIKFMRTYSTGKLKEYTLNYFTDENNSFLSILFDEYASQSLIPDSVRLGISVIKGDNSVVNARLYQGKGICSCQFYLKQENGKWKIHNISGNLTDMLVNYEKSEKEFEPEVYYFF